MVTLRDPGFIKGTDMKRSLFVAASAFALLMQPAFAADIPVKAPNYKAAPAYDPWVGGYAGVNAGYSWGDWNAASNQPVFFFLIVKFFNKIVLNMPCQFFHVYGIQNSIVQ